MSGNNLATILEKRGNFTAAEIWHVLESLLPLLALLHSRQVIYGDIQPKNIFYLRTLDSKKTNSKTDSIGSVQSLEHGSVELIDWRIALRSPTPLDTIGSPEYAAPEQLAGNAVYASDLYSLGVTCIHALTGLPPFDLIDSVSNRWLWRTYWQGEIEHSAPADQCLELADFLDRLIEPQLDQRFSSAAAAIAQIQSLRRKTLPTPKLKPTWKSYATLIGHQGLFAGINAIAIAANHKTLTSASDDTTIRLWDLPTGDPQFTLKGHTQSVQCLAFSPKDLTLMASGSRDRSLKLWDVEQHQELRTLIGHQSAVNTVAFSPHGDILASGSADRTVKLWNSQTGELITTLMGARLAITAIAFHPVQPILVAASADSAVRVWNLTTLEPIHTLSTHRGSVRAIAFNPDGTLLATGGQDRTIRLWETSAWQCIRVLPGHSWPISALTFMPNGEVLASGSWDKTMKLWQVSTGIEMEVLSGHLDTVTGIAIAERAASSPPTGSATPDSGVSEDALIASCSLDKTVRLWMQQKSYPLRGF